MKTLTRSVSGKATDRTYEIFMKAFKQLRMQVRDGMIAPVRLIGINLQNISMLGARQLTIKDVYGHQEQVLTDRWEKAIRNLELKYNLYLNANKDRETISKMEHRHRIYLHRKI